MFPYGKKDDEKKPCADWLLWALSSIGRPIATKEHPVPPSKPRVRVPVVYRSKENKEEKDD